MQSNIVGSNIVSRINPTESGAKATPNGKLNKNEFQDVLNGFQQPKMIENQELKPQGLKFSQHSVERMHSRGIRFSPEEMQAIENGVQKALAKGSKNSLVLTDKNALIVSTKNNTVVTVMDRAAMKENVFTNIDSTVMV